jgi:hypothetical protein
MREGGQRKGVTMAFVPGYDHDVFVSYAHVDDEPLSGAPHGWVTTLVGNLETIVRQKLGYKQFEFWMDQELAGNAPLTPAILDALSKTALQLVVVSPGYLASEWCAKERQAFLQKVRERLDAGSRAFLVYYDKVERDRLPAEFRDLIGYPFWVEAERGAAPRTLGIPVPTPDEKEYYSRVNQLAHEISQELQRLSAAGTGAAVAATERPAILLAECTEDLDMKREEVRRFLSQAGFDVLPSQYYPRDDPAAFAGAMQADLARSAIFVQLLSGVVGRRPPNLPQGYPAFQHEVAAKAGVRVLQWRSRDVDPASAEEPQHRALLEGETVRACGIEEFKQAILEEARRKPPPPPHVPDATNILVFVNNDSPDRGLADQVARVLIAQGVGYSMPLQQGSPEDIRRDLEDNLRTSDGLLLVYGATTAAWVRSQLRQSRKIISGRDQPIRALAVFEGPPPDKAGLDFMLPDLQHLDCRNGLDQAAIQRFVGSLKP